MLPPLTDAEVLFFPPFPVVVAVNPSEEPPLDAWVPCLVVPAELPDELIEALTDDPPFPVVYPVVYAPTIVVLKAVPAGVTCP